MKLYNGWLRPKSCESGACIEVIKGEDGMIKLRSSLSPYSVATMTEAEFRDFIESAKGGDYDHFYDDEEPSIELATLTASDIESVAIASSGGFKSNNVELLDGGVFTWEEAEALAKAQVIDYEQRRDQQLVKEGYTGDLR